MVSHRKLPSQMESKIQREMAELRLMREQLEKRERDRGERESIGPSMRDERERREGEGGRKDRRVCVCVWASVLSSFQHSF